MRRLRRALIIAGLAGLVPLSLAGTARGFFWTHMHYWGANGNAKDAFGGPTGELTNGATYGPGNTGQAFLFNGAGSYVDFGSSVGNFGTGDFSVGFNLNTTQSGNVAVVNRRAFCYFSNFWDIRLVDGHVVGELDESSNGPDYTLITSNAVVNDGQWHRIALGRQGTTVYLEVDGLRDAQVTSRAIANINNATSLHAGVDVCDGIDGTASLNGRIDDLFIGSAN